MSTLLSLVPTFLFVLSGCARDKMRDSAPGDQPDSGIAPDTSESGSTNEGDSDTDQTIEPWSPTIPECAAARPIVLDEGSLPGPWELYGPNEIDLRVFYFEIDAMASGHGCPTREDSPSGMVFSGSCAGEGYAWSGTWEEVEVASSWDYDVSVYAHDAYAVNEYGAIGTFQADGNAESAWNEADGTGFFLRSLTMTLAEYDRSPSIDGVWEIESVESWGPGNRFDASVTGAYAEEGDELHDYCLLIELAHSPRCALEPWGGWLIVGDRTLVATYDPETNCDGCANVTLDGIAAGSVCE